MLKKLLSLYEESLFRNSIYLMLATGILSGFGFFFWLIATRLFRAEDIGLATALISVMNLIAILSLLGFNVAFVRYRTDTAETNDQMNTGMILVGLAACILAVAFLAFVRILSPSLDFVANNLSVALLFIFFCVMSALNGLTDAVFLARRKTNFILVINTLFSAIKMVLPFAFIGLGALGIFAAAALAQTVGFGLSIGVMMWKFDYRPRFVIQRSVLRRVWIYCTGNYIGSIFNLLPVCLLPIIITNDLGAASAAYYYISMMIGNLLYVIPVATTRAFFAEGSHNEKTIEANIRASILIISLLLIPSILILLIGGNLILNIFGKSYAEGGVDFLRLVALTGIAIASSSILNSLFQIRKNMRAIIVVNTLYAITIIALSYALLPLGLIGVGVAWLSGSVVSSLVGYLFYRLPTNLLKHIRVAAEEFYFTQKTRLSCKIRYFRAVSRYGVRAIALFYPQLPRPDHILYPICHELRIAITNDPRAAADIIIAFDDTTIRKKNPLLTELCTSSAVINAACNDISKDHLAVVFHEIFGYGMTIDPRTATSAYVQKSNTNALHDGVVRYAPTEPEDGYVYQKLINNTCGDDSVMDIRVHVFKDTIPFTWYRYKSIHDRFDTTIRAECVETDTALSRDEQNLIIRFCKKFGLDFGELDVLRDTDGRIYIVDANNTPAGPQPGVHISTEEYTSFLRMMCDSFASAFLSSEK